MANQGLLIAAIATKLRTDTGAGSLVTLTGHAAGNFRIARDKPPTKGTTPFLGIRVPRSPPISESVTMIQIARVYFYCYAAKEPLAFQIADRLEALLHVTPTRTNNNYYDFSDLNISCRSTRYKNRKDPIFDKDTDVFKILVEAEAIWADAACP